MCAGDHHMRAALRSDAVWGEELLMQQVCSTSQTQSVPPKASQRSLSSVTDSLCLGTAGPASRRRQRRQAPRALAGAGGLLRAAHRCTQHASGPHSESADLLPSGGRTEDVQGAPPRWSRSACTRSALWKPLAHSQLPQTCDFCPLSCSVSAAGAASAAPQAGRPAGACLMGEATWLVPGGALLG
jgi:hypothetical protein